MAGPPRKLTRSAMHVLRLSSGMKHKPSNLAMPRVTRSTTRTATETTDTGHKENGTNRNSCDHEICQTGIPRLGKHKHPDEDEDEEDEEDEGDDNKENHSCASYSGDDLQKGDDHPGGESDEDDNSDDYKQDNDEEKGDNGERIQYRFSTRSARTAAQESVCSEESLASGSQVSEEPRNEHGQLIKDYDLHHPEKRRNINQLYFVLSIAERNPSSAVSPENVQTLVDRLIVEFLPHFWAYRQIVAKCQATKNLRPHERAMLLTCVECGFKFHKELMYSETAKERRGTRAKNEANRGLKRVGNTSRSQARAKRTVKAIELFRTRIGSNNSSFSDTDIVDVINNNLRSSDYDGNLDYVGPKGEHPKNCRGGTTKMFLGWYVVPGHDHSSICQGSLRNKNPYYASRSLLAAFVHILPRGQDVTQNQMRKLFTYFVWHPVFDCDLQAMIFRSAYRELWPQFVLRDETWEEESGDHKQNGKRYGHPQGPKNKGKDGKWPGTRSPSCAKSELIQEDQEYGDASRKRSNRDLTPAEGAAIERDRLVMIETRFSNEFRKALRDHGVTITSRKFNDQEQARKFIEEERGWILGASEYLGSDGNILRKYTMRDNSISLPKANAVHRTFDYRVPPSDNGLQEVSMCLRLPRMSNVGLTAPHTPDAPARLCNLFDEISQKAAANRKALGFVMPEYMVSNEEKLRVRKRRASSADIAEPTKRTRTRFYDTSLEGSASYEGAFYASVPAPTTTTTTTTTTNTTTTAGYGPMATLNGMVQPFAQDLSVSPYSHAYQMPHGGGYLSLPSWIPMPNNYSQVPTLYSQEQDGQPHDGLRSDLALTVPPTASSSMEPVWNLSYISSVGPPSLPYLVPSAALPTPPYSFPSSALATPPFALQKDYFPASAINTTAGATPSITAAVEFLDIDMDEAFDFDAAAVPKSENIGNGYPSPLSTFILANSGLSDGFRAGRHQDGSLSLMTAQFDEISTDYASTEDATDAWLPDAMFAVFDGQITEAFQGHYSEQEDKL